MSISYHKYTNKAMAAVDRRHAGFTIVELLIVIVVVAILAALSFVVYRNIQNNARSSVAESNLAQAKKQLSLYRAEYGSYPATGNQADAGVVAPSGFIYDYTSGDGTAYCLTSVDAGADIVYRVSGTTSPLPGGCPEHSWPGGVTVTNMVTNGDLSAGLAGWLTAAVGPVSVEDGAAVFTPISNDISGSGQQNFYQTVSLATGQTYYIRADAFGKARMALTTYSYPSNTAHTWGSYSATQVSTVTGSRAFGVRTTQTSAWEEIRAKNLVMINLTEAFGAGNEPTKAQMDQVMQQFPNNHFSGSATVSL